MTHPNVEYWAARVLVNKESNKASQDALKREMMKAGDNDELFKALVNAHGRMDATMSLTQSLLEQIQHYEEQIALLK